MRPLKLSLEEIRDLLETRHRLAAGTGGKALLVERLAMYAALVNERCERPLEQFANATELSKTLHGAPNNAGILDRLTSSKPDGDEQPST